MSITKKQVDDVWNDVTKDNKFVVYPDVNLTIDYLKKEFNMSDEVKVQNPEDLQVSKLATLPVDSAELEAEEKIMEDVDDELIQTIDEFSKELTDEEKHEIFIQQLKKSRIKFHPIKHGVIKTVGVIEKPTVFGRKHIEKSREIDTSITTNQFGAEYRKKRQRKNRMAKASRKANR